MGIADCSQYLQSSAGFPSLMLKLVRDLEFELRLVNRKLKADSTVRRSLIDMRLQVKLRLFNASHWLN